MPRAHPPPKWALDFIDGGRRVFDDVMKPSGRDHFGALCDQADHLGYGAEFSS